MSDHTTPVAGLGGALARVLVDGLQEAVPHAAALPVRDGHDQGLVDEGADEIGGIAVLAQRAIVAMPVQSAFALMREIIYCTIQVTVKMRKPSVQGMIF